MFNFAQDVGLGVPDMGSKILRLSPLGIDTSLRSHDQNRRPRPLQTGPCLLFSVTVSRRKYKSRKSCIWDLSPYARPIGCISSAAHRGPCMAAAVMPSDHHHPRLSQTRHVVMHHYSHPSILFGHFQSMHPVATPALARCPGLQNLIFALLHLHGTTRTPTRKRPRRPCWKRSRVANRRTSCCAVSHLSIVTRLFRKRAQIHLHTGTVLNADGTPSDHTLIIIHLGRAYHAWFY